MFPNFPLYDRHREERIRREPRYDLYERQIQILESQISQVNQNIYNSGYMSNVYQQNYVNQVARTHRR